MKQPTFRPLIKGFSLQSKKNASGKKYTGRFVCPNVQWTEDGDNSWLTFTITAEELADAAEGNLLWTDQDVQRGIKPDLIEKPEKEISLSIGYPDVNKYVFDSKNADDMVEKLLSGDRLFLSPLVWNLRPDSFDAYYDNGEESVYIYNGKIFLPDSHHRQQAIVKAVKLWRDTPSLYPKFSGAKQFKIELYFLTKEDEGNYFFDKNQRPRPTAKSKAYDLTTQDDLSLLAKRVIEKSHILNNNVNRVTDRLNSNNPQMITLSTLREMMKAFAGVDYIDSEEMDGLAAVAAEFIDMLGNVRPELEVCSRARRNEIREKYIVDSAVMLNGYIYLMREYNTAIAELGGRKAKEIWQKKLAKMSSTVIYFFQTWSGDFFEKKNPLWTKHGICKPSRNLNKTTVMNSGSARISCGKLLLALINNNQNDNDIENLM